MRCRASAAPPSTPPSPTTPPSTGSGGNQTAGLGRIISYTSYNKPSSITQGSSTLFFSDDFGHQRFKQTAPEGITLYFSAFGVHTELFSSAVSQWTDYLMVGGAMVGMRVLHSDESVSTRLPPRLDRRHHQRDRRRRRARLV
jgi:hypothetical protein